RRWRRGWQRGRGAGAHADDAGAAMTRDEAAREPAQAVDARSIDTLLAHGAVEPARETGAIVPSIHPATTFARDRDHRLPGAPMYARDQNPTFAPAEELLVRLEGGAAALLFSSGMAAATAVFQTLAPGDHVIAQRTMYWGLRQWLVAFCARWQLELALVDPHVDGALAAALRPGRTALVWLECPSNPTWDVADLAAAAALAHGAGARLAVDSTAATPVHTRPLALGADLVMHAATKYLNGHSDVIAGALVTARLDDAWARLCAHRHDAGAILGPFEAWLLHRGMRTLAVRVRRQSASALAIARALDGHPRIAAVLYPGLPSHHGHAIAARQMRDGFGGMLSVRVDGGADAALAVAGRLRLFARATSLGGVESLVEHRASVEPPDSPVPKDLLRLSIGLEDPDELIADLLAALA
ncbi:MAG TPA: PLP-dependent aspartate aminotransferase family protein, partial [Kofleriaceae bacterium]|nr:PLP-dependent aspartate aminotransferase family protein [Kofleriaceae bacterium]